eukprot:COSAG02_NODE_10279_length_1979_cov_1.568617_4_plen_106_part_00
MGGLPSFHSAAVAAAAAARRQRRRKSVADPELNSGGDGGDGGGIDLYDFHFRSEPKNVHLPAGTGRRGGITQLFSSVSHRTIVHRTAKYAQYICRYFHSFAGVSL